MHHLRSVRISVPGGHRASADHHRPAPRRGEHRQVGGRLRHQAVPRAGTQRQRARLQLHRARQVHRRSSNFRSSTARRNTACGSAAWARYDPQGREIIASFARVMTHLGTTFGVLQERKVHGRSGAPPGQRSGVPAARRTESGNAEASQGHEDRLHLPALRAHHFHRLEGVRRSPADRASQRIHGAPSWTSCRKPTRRQDRVSRSLLSGPLSRRLRRAARGARAGRAK